MDDRIGRDLKRQEVAVRMLSHGARPKTICAFTSLRPERIKTLRAHFNLRSKERRRGPSPSALKGFFQPAHKHKEASCIAGYCRMLGAVTAQGIEDAPRFYPTLIRAERLCDVFESYHTVFPGSEFTFEIITAIAIGLAQGDLIGLGQCSSCPRAILIDRLATGDPVCWECRPRKSRKKKRRQ